MADEPIKCFMVEGWKEACDNPGAMFWSNHPYEDRDNEKRPKPHLRVCTPVGIVCLDCPESDSSAMWQRTGEPPNITVTPSLNVSDDEWHGFLTNGELVR